MRQPGVRQLHLHLHAVLPEVVGTRLQRLLKMLVKVQQPLLVRRHGNFFAHMGRQLRQYVGGDLTVRGGTGGADYLEFMLLGSGPEGVLSDAERTGKFPVNKVQAHLLVPHLCNNALPGKLLVLQKGFQQAPAAEQHTVHGDGLHLAAAKEAVFSGVQRLHKFPVLKEQALFILVNNDLLHV